MENIQINGQRRWGPPSDWSGPPPPHGTEVFVKNLAQNILEEELYQTFSTVGKVYEVRLPVHWSGENRGYAFVRFTKVEEADEAIKTLNGAELRPGWRIQVQRSVDNTRLFLSSVPKCKTGDQLKEDLSEFVENVRKVYVYPTLEDRNVFRGYAFVEFETHRDAAIAKRILTPDMCSSLFGSKCIAAWANPLPFIDGDLLETLNILFMRNIPKELNTSDLKKELKTILGGDETKRVKRLNDFAFLTFDDHQSAQKALDKLKGNPRLSDLYEIQVEWAIPRELVNGFPERNKQFSSFNEMSKSAGNIAFENRSLIRPRLQNKIFGSGVANAYGLVPFTRANLGTIYTREKEEKAIYLRLCDTRDSSLSPNRANSPYSSVALWNSESEDSRSPPSNIFINGNRRITDANLPSVPLRAFYKANLTSPGAENLDPFNRGTYCF